MQGRGLMSFCISYYKPLHLGDRGPWIPRASAREKGPGWPPRPLGRQGKTLPNAGERVEKPRINHTHGKP